MSMIGKLRQVSEFDLAKYKKNPGELVRALAATPLREDPQIYAPLREMLEQSPAVQRMRELGKQGQLPAREVQAELQKEMMNLLKNAQEMRKSALSKRSDSRTDPSRNSAAQDAADLDLHKSWHCLHFLLCGRVDGSDGTALGDAVLGGTEIGGEQADTGYGPPRALSPAQVRNISSALGEFPIAQKAKEFDSAVAEKAGIYVANHEPQELEEYFGQLREFYKDAASKGNAVLIWIE